LDRIGEGFKHALAEAPGYGPGHQWYAVCLVSRGRFDDALAQIRQAVNADPASLILGQGHDDVALTLLAQAADARFPWAIHYNIDPMLDTIRNRPAFKVLLDRIGLPQVQLPAAR
jgi:hypothetical protein